MPNLKEKESRARARLVGKKVRPPFSTGPFKECVRVIANGPPSGWTVSYQVFTGRGQNNYFNVERITDVEIEKDSK